MLDWRVIARGAAFAAAAMLGAGAFALSGIWPLSLVLAILAASGAALFSLGVTLGWKGLDSFSEALSLALALPLDQRRAFRRSSRRERGLIVLAMATNTMLCAVPGAAFLLYREGIVPSDAVSWLAFWSGSAIGVSLMFLVALFRVYFSGDDLVGEVADLVKAQEQRARDLDALGRGDEGFAKAADSLPVRKLVVR